MNKTTESTADRVRLLRSYLHISQEELGQRVGVAKSTISGVETGAQGISGIAAKLAAALGTTTDYLYGLSDNPLPPDDEEIEEKPPHTALLSAIVAEVEQLDEINQQVVLQMAMTLRLASERRNPRVVT